MYIHNRTSELQEDKIPDCQSKEESKWRACFHALMWKEFFHVRIQNHNRWNFHRMSKLQRSPGLSSFVFSLLPAKCMKKGKKQGFLI